MTALIAINLGDIAIIAADKKEVFILGETVIPIHEDADKIVDTRIGLMTGSGYVPLLQEVKDQVSSASIHHTDQIISHIHRAQQKVKDADSFSDQQKAQILTTTGWLFTYQTISDGRTALRVALYHPSLSTSHLSIIDRHQTKIVFPPDLDGDQVAYYTELIATRFNPIGQGSVQEVISNNVSLILTIFSQLSQVSQSVSEAADIGLVTSSGERYLAKSVTINSADLEFVPISS